MKRAIILVLAVVFSTVSFSQSDNSSKKYEKVGDLVSVTKYYEDGSIKEQGFYKDKKLHGEWTKYNQEGERVVRAYYLNGEKSGTWMYLNNDILTEVNYTDNKIASVYEWNNKTKIASN